MKITYIHHSAFLAELNTVTLLFDYTEGQLPSRNSAIPLLVFSSHRHYDHYSEKILEFGNEYANVQYILSDDIKQGQKQRLISSAPHSQYPPNTFFLKPEEHLCFQIKDGKAIPIRRSEPIPSGWADIEILTFRSTDEGVAFLVKAEGKTIYHAGDLNNWKWTGEPEEWNGDMARRYSKEVNKLADMNVEIDAAFLPLDPRQQENFYLGFDEFMRKVSVKCGFPMHCWGDFSVIDRLKGMGISAPYRERIVNIHQDLEVFEIGDSQETGGFPARFERIWVQNARLLDPLSKTERDADICIEDEKIIFIGKAEGSGPFSVHREDQVIDASGCIAAPGLVDIHVHFREPGLTYKEDIQTGAKAAAKGGFTTVVCMANTKPPVDNVETLEYIRQEGEKTGIRILQAAAVSKGLLGRELTDMEELKAHGAVGFTDDGIPLLNETLVKEAMEMAAKLKLPLSLHEENPAFITNNGIHQGKVSKALGIIGSPALAEDALVARDCMIALHTQAVINIQHISSKASVQMVKLAKELGARVYAEATPHHFSLTEDALLQHGTLAKMNPPLRTEADRQAIIQGLKDGTIDCIATDHAPHSAEEKSGPLTAAPSGIIGLETALGLGITCLVRPGHLTMGELIEKMSTNPARLYGLDLGYTEEGKAADLVIFDPEAKWIAGNYASKASNSPFTGQTLFGKVRYTICKGRVVYRDQETK